MTVVQHYLKQVICSSVGGDEAHLESKWWLLVCEKGDETVLHSWLSSTWRNVKTCMSVVFSPLPLSPVMGSHPPGSYCLLLKVSIQQHFLPFFLPLLPSSLVMTGIFQHFCLFESWMNKALGETPRWKELQRHKVLSSHCNKEVSKLAELTNINAARCCGAASLYRSGKAQTLKAVHWVLKRGLSDANSI